MFANLTRLITIKQKENVVCMMREWNSGELNQIVRTQIKVIDLACVTKKNQFHLKRMKKLNGNKSLVHWSSKSRTCESNFMSLLLIWKVIENHLNKRIPIKRQRDARAYSVLSNLQSHTFKQKWHQEDDRKVYANISCINFFFSRYEYWHTFNVKTWKRKLKYKPWHMYRTFFMWIQTAAMGLQYSIFYRARERRRENNCRTHSMQPLSR